ncbi:MAG: hypothetical protein E5W25_10465 [Mesorhizobium sp.]|nr:MAG: hypothetical protein E5W25_10465 [Mesorhizobium sp.]
MFDTWIDEPADYAGCVLAGLTLREAQWFAAVANVETSARVRNPLGVGTLVEPAPVIGVF